MEPLVKKFNRVIEEDKGINNQTDIKGESFSKKFAGKLLSTAGNLFRSEFEDSSLPQNKSAQPQIDLKDISDTLIKQNYQLKSLAENQQKEIEDLKDRLEMITDLEQNANNENENLKYQLLSLKHGESEPNSPLKEQRQKVLEQVKDLKMQKRDQEKEIEQLKQQIQGYKDLLEQNCADQGEVRNDPVLMLKQLNMLYSVHKEELSLNDNTNIFISLLMKDTRVYKHYRERLYQKVAKQAMDTSEFLCKINSGIQSGQQIQQESKVFKENKSLKQTVKDLQTQLDQEKKNSHNLQTLLDQRGNISQHKFEQMKQKLKKAQNQIVNIKGSFFQIRNQQEDLQEFGQQIIQPNLQLLLQKIKQNSAQSSKNLQEARKAVFEKNKQISELSLKNSELSKQLTDGQQNNQLIYQKNKQIGDLFNSQKQLQQEIEEYKEMCENYQDQCNMLKEKLIQDQDKESVQVKEMKVREGKLQKEIEDLKNQIKEMKHIEVVKSLMKNSDQVNEEVEKARKSVLEKNKMISEMFNKQNELMQLIQEKDEEIMKLKKGSDSKSQQPAPSYGYGQAPGQQQQEQDFFGGFFKNIWGQVQNQTQNSTQPRQETQIDSRPKTQMEPEKPVQQNSQAHLNFNFLEQSEEEVEKKLKIVEEKYQTDSPSRIFHLQEHSHSQPAMRFSHTHHEPPKKEVSFKDVTMTQKVLESNNLFVSETHEHDDFFESIKKLSPPKEKENKKESLDFLNDMFSGLLGNTVSQSMGESKQEEHKNEQAKEEIKKVELGWEADNDLDIEVEFENDDQIEISSDKQGFGMESQDEQQEVQVSNKGEDLQRIPTFSQMNSFMKDSDALKMSLYQSPSQAIIQEENNQDICLGFDEDLGNQQNELGQRKQNPNHSSEHKLEEDREDEKSPQFESIAHQQEIDGKQLVVDKGWDGADDLEIDIDVDVENIEIPQQSETIQAEVIEEEIKQNIEEDKEKIVEVEKDIQIKKQFKDEDSRKVNEEDKVEGAAPIQTNQVGHIEAGWNEDDLDLDVFKLV